MVKERQALQGEKEERRQVVRRERQSERRGKKNVEGRERGWEEIKLFLRCFVVRDRVENVAATNTHSHLDVSRAHWT